MPGRCIFGFPLGSSVPINAAPFSPACANVSLTVVVSPWSASCRVTAKTAPLFKSTACSALCARCVRPSFILVNPRVSIMRMDPIFVAGFVLSLAIHPRQIFAPRRVDSRFLRQSSQKFLVTLSIVSPHDGTHRRVGLQRGRVDPHGLTLQQPLISQQF